MAKTKSFSDQLRRAILTADVSRYQISKATGIPQGNLSHFVHGDNGLSMTNVDLICAYLKLRLISDERE